MNDTCDSMNTIKSTIFFTLFLAFTLLLPTSIVNAEEEKSIVSVETVYEGNQNKIVEISLYIHGSEQIAGGSLELLYDKTKLTVQKVENGDQLMGYLASANKDQVGHVSLTWAKATGQTQKGTLLTITAKLAKANETIALDLQDVQLWREDISLMAVESFDGEVKPFAGKADKHKEKVKVDKEWTVRLNKPFNPATVNKHTVTVKDSRGKEIDVKIEALDNTTFVVSPKGKYVSKATYTLEITEQVRELNGNKLKQPVKYEFSIE